MSFYSFHSYKYYVIIALFFGLVACNGSKTLNNKSKETPLMMVGKTQISVKEFKYMYEKSTLNNDSLYKEKNLREYIEPFKNYKLKVQEALNKGFDTTDAQVMLHRWRYASGGLEPMIECHYSSNDGIGLCGDWLHGGRVEGAWLSGIKLANLMNQ
ncbi:MAG: hypothetical protein EAZ20_02600 [Bacteroidetes bacterium]|nr:MAG: hypothetical protein EAZ20_02600 [Bacteroidota bacterium]